MNVPIVREFVQRIAAAPDVVFPLLCPIREGEWAEGWAEACELIWSQSGLAEVGCVFRTTGHGDPETIWVIDEHDPRRGIIGFVRVTEGLVATTLRIRVSPTGSAASSVAIRYVVTPVSAEGAMWAAAGFSEAAFHRSMVWWERSMNHFIVTGRMLRAADIH